MMISQRNLALGRKRSVIRELFEYGLRRKAEIGADKVFDFSLGNPSVPAPDKVGDITKNLLETVDAVTLHGYTSAPGDMAVRQAVADDLNSRFGAGAAAGNIYMTCGAAASLTVTLSALMCEGDEVIVLAPYFPEYRVFIETAGGKVVEVPCMEGSFQIDVAAVAAAITPHTKAIIINSPCNPTGAVFSRQSLLLLAEVLKKAEQSIYIIADEPYRELTYGVEVPFIPAIYDNTVVCYSFSKSLSLPGERIGYIYVPSAADESDALFAAVCGAGRALGYVCAPSLMQRVVAQCLSDTADVSVYERNRSLLYDSLTEMGYTAVRPDGAFYLFVKALEEDATAFCEAAKQHELLLVPSDDFGCKGWVRIAYCVQTSQIEAALPAFKALYEQYKGGLK